ncbi:MAG TPA: IS1182 family transposase [Thermoguttaceae bacterium]|nr:IS1182 family transposase [Thermoguttaceae bacterium]
MDRPHRSQVQMHFFSLDQLLPDDHQARIVWAFVQSLDLEPFYQKIEVNDNVAGRSAIAPEILLALWLLATLDGIGSARELGRRCETDIPYIWIRGNVSVNYHTLSDFRVQNGEFLEQILVDTVASLIDRGLVPLETIAQDGMRVRASAGSSSFRRKPSLQKLQQQAQEHLDRLKQEAENESDRQERDARRQAAAERAARERQQRIDEALRQHEKLSDQREKRKKGDGEQTRVSTTDPDARKMKMANGGYRPAYNVQFATDAQSRVIVSVDVTNAGTDGGELAPMHEKVSSDYGKVPEKMVVDAAYATKQGVTTVEAAGTEVVSTVPRSEELKKRGKDPHARQRDDTDEYARFRARMALPEYQALYKQRPSIAEFPNADCRNRNLQQFRVRGLVKVKAVAIWHALAFNFRRMLNLGVLAG